MFLLDKTELEEMLKKLKWARDAGKYPESEKMWICPLCYEVYFSDKACQCDNDW